MPTPKPLTLELDGKIYRLIPYEGDGPTRANEHPDQNRRPYVYTGGGACWVYRAIEESGRPVLIKEYSFRGRDQARVSYERITQAILAFKSRGGAYLASDRPDLISTFASYDEKKKIFYQIFDDLGTDLNALDTSQKSRALTTTLRTFIDFLEGLQALHAEHLLHLDIKSSNIVEITPNTKDGIPIWQPIDFGSALTIEELIEFDFPLLDSTDGWYSQDDIRALQKKYQEESQYSKSVLGANTEYSEKTSERHFNHQLCYVLDTTAAARVLFFILTGSQVFPTSREALVQAVSSIMLNKRPLTDEAPASFERLVDVLEKGFLVEIESRYQSCQDMISDLNTIFWSLSKDHCNNSVQAKKLSLLNEIMKDEEIFRKYQGTTEVILPHIKLDDGCLMGFAGLMDKTIDNLLLTGEAGAGKSFLLTGEAGAGKSSTLLYYYVNTLKATDCNRICFYVSLHKLYRDGLESKLREIDQFSSDFDQITVLLDSWDESQIDFEDLLNISEQKSYRVVITSRFVPSTRRDGKKIDLPKTMRKGAFLALTDDQLTQYMGSGVSIDSSMQLFEILHNPMLLSIFKKISESRGGWQYLKNEADLFHAYFLLLLEKASQGNALSEDKNPNCLELIGFSALDHLPLWTNPYFVTDDRVNSDLVEEMKETLKALSTICKTDDKGHLVFSHQMFEDYCIAIAYSHSLKTVVDMKQKFSVRSQKLQELYFKTPYFGKKAKKSAENSINRYSYQVLLFVSQMQPSKSNDEFEEACRQIYEKKERRKIIFSIVRFLLPFILLVLTCTPFWLQFGTNFVGITRILFFILPCFPNFHVNEHIDTFIQDLFWIQSFQQRAEIFDSFKRIGILKRTSSEKGENPLKEIYIPKCFSNVNLNGSRVARVEVSPKSKYFMPTDDGHGLIRKFDKSCVFIGRVPKISCKTTKKIKNHAFGIRDCLETVEFPNAEKLGRGALENCKRLKSVSLPKVKNIPAFALYRDIDDIDIEESLKSFEWVVRVSLLESVDVSGAKIIGKCAFCGCSSLVELDLRNAAKIGKYAFVNCSSLEVLYLSSRCKSIGSGAFGNCMKLREINFDGLQKQWLRLSQSNRKLGAKKCTIHCQDGDITYEGELERAVCRTRLKRLWWRSREIGELVLLDKKDFKEHEHIDMSDPFLLGEIRGLTLSLLDFKNLKKLVIHATSFPCERLVLPSGETLEDDNFVIPESVEILELPNAEKFPPETHLPNGLKMLSAPALSKIGKDAFRFSKIERVFLPSIQQIGDSAFGYCSSLTEISLPSIQQIGDFAFEKCSSLTEVSMPSIQQIGDSAFGYCSSLTEIFLPSIQQIGDLAFDHCSSLKSIVLPKTVQIGNYAFAGCEKLEEMIFDGSKAEWNAICKDIRALGIWHQITIRCSDGDLNLNIGVSPQEMYDFFKEFRE